MYKKKITQTLFRKTIINYRKAFLELKHILKKVHSFRDLDYSNDTPKLFNTQLLIII